MEIVIIPNHDPSDLINPTCLKKNLTRPELMYGPSSDQNFWPAIKLDLTQNLHKKIRFNSTQNPNPIQPDRVSSWAQAKKIWPDGLVEPGSGQKNTRFYFDPILTQPGPINDRIYL